VTAFLEYWGAALIDGGKSKTRKRAGGRSALRRN
jgi:hypothetical protein